MRKDRSERGTFSLSLSTPSSSFPSRLPNALTHYASPFLLHARLRRPRLPRRRGRCAGSLDGRNRSAQAGNRRHGAAAASEAAFSWPLLLMGIGRKEGRKGRRERGREGGCRYEAGTEESEEAAIVVVTCCTS